MSATPRTDALASVPMTRGDSDEFARTLEREHAALRELHNMQLAAISTATIQNTAATVKDRIGTDNPYYTTAYGDTCRAVDREMKLIAANAALRLALEDAVSTFADKDVLVTAERQEAWLAVLKETAP